MNATGVISRYQILDKIGDGGMGSLFLARDPVIDRLVAIKLLRSGFDTPELRDRFAREARAAGRLRHPNIVTIFDVGEHEGNPFIAMEFLAGETLHELIQAKARLSLARRLKLLEELCDGLAYAHRAGIVHRDIKPANLLVDSDGVLKILDFGIVRLDDGGVTQSGVLVGTLNYMSPEQVSGGEIDRRSDIFSVGLVAYELLSLRQAFPGTIRDGLLNRILNVSVEPLPNVMPGLDPEVAAIVEQALKPEVEERYSDLTRMRNDLIRVRKRVEAIEEEIGGADDSAGETMLVTRPGVPTPASGIPADGDPSSWARSSAATYGIEAAERALSAGEYRTALSLAGRSAAANPEDRTAALIMARAQTALLDRGRKMESGILPRSGSASVPAFAAPAPSPVLVLPAPVAAEPPGRSRRVWYAGGAAVILLAGAMIGWIMQSAKPTGGGAIPAQPSISAPAVVPDPPPAAPAQEPMAGATQPPEPPERTPGPAPGRNPAPPSATATGAAAAARRSASPEPPAPSVYTVGRDGIGAPRRLRFVDPVYPPAAAASRVEGTVGLELTIGRDGRVADARVTRSVPGLDQAALNAARQWQYEPVILRGSAVPVIHSVSVPFTAPVAAAPAAASPVVAEPPPSAPARPAATAAAPAPAESKEPARTPDPPSVDLRAEEGAVRAVLRQYQAAWESRDADAVARVQRLSSDGLNSIRATLKSAEDYRMVLDIQNVVVEADGQRARARASVARTYNPRAGNPIRVPSTVSTFSLEKRDGRWLITSIK